jgi:hypothetical protein
MAAAAAEEARQDEEDSVEGLPCPAAWGRAVSDASFCQPSQTLIFLDFDDTLFPTTELMDRWGIPATWASLRDPELELSSTQEELLAGWRCALAQYVKAACALSERCCIITNARTGWVDACIAKFAPSLSEMFLQLRIVYARDCTRRRSKKRLDPSLPRGAPVEHVDMEMQNRECDAEDLTKMKLEAMKVEAKEFYSQYSNQTWENIVSVGDAAYEFHAVQELAFRRKCGSLKKVPSGEHLRVKAIKTKESPTLSELTDQLELGASLLSGFVAYDGDISLDMTRPHVPALVLYADL